MRPSPAKTRGTVVYESVEDTQAFVKTQEDEQYPKSTLEELQTNYDLSDDDLEA